MKRFLPILLAAALLLAAGCAAPADQPGGLPEGQPPEATPGGETPASPSVPTAPAVEEEPVLFTDSIEREVLIPQPLYKIAPGNAEAQATLYAFAPELLAGWYAVPGPEASEFLSLSALALPELIGQDGAFDHALLQASGAQVVLFMGGAMDAAALDALQEAQGLPVLYIASGLDSLPDAYRALGGMLGMEELAEEFVEYIQPAVADIAEKAGSLPVEERKTVYIASGEGGRTPLDSDVLTLAGAVNAVPAEQIGKPLADAPELYADAILAADDATYALLGKNEQWQAREDVQMGLYYQAPNAPFDWLMDSVSVNKLLGAKWLGCLLYEDVFGYDLIEETKLHYDLFWHCQLTDAQAEGLLGKSVMKTIG